MKSEFYWQEKVSTFFSPNKTMLGKDSISGLGKEVRTLGGKKVLIVTDPGIVESGLVKIVEDALVSENIVPEVFDDIELEPRAGKVDECVQFLKKESCNLIIGLGGGSALDVAKGAAILATNGGKILDYVGIDQIPKRGIPNILIPTTAGTGSEASRAVVIKDESDNTKKALNSQFLLTDVAILDPSFTVSMPPTITANTGLDALVHAIEAYVSVTPTPFSEILSMESIRHISQNLPIAYAKGSNIYARYNMLLAAYFAGLAFSSSGLGAVHALAYVLCTEHGIPHGRANAIILPHIMSFNILGNPKKYADIASAMGENTDNCTVFEAAEKSVSSIRRLLNSVNVSFRLSDYGITKKDLPALVKGGMKQSRLFNFNPRDLLEEDVHSIYEIAL
jgi:alcohol dehydrogenase